ncbi:hypothetical protein [Mesorhizobium amorphae]|uniref:ABC transporter ATP-binding protein C-terminal domain-containing protein n=1 Tax=Mesorhizobium amorphae TaxID=71433 RepID=UPI00391F66F7
MAGDRADPGAGPVTDPDGRAHRRHDGAGDQEDGAALQPARRPPHADRRRARHGFRARHRPDHFCHAPGRLLAEGSIADIESNQAVRDAYLGSGGIGHA